MRFAWLPLLLALSLLPSSGCGDDAGGDAGRDAGRTDAATDGARSDAGGADAGGGDAGGADAGGGDAGGADAGRADAGGGLRTAVTGGCYRRFGTCDNDGQCNPGGCGSETCATEGVISTCDCTMPTDATCGCV